MSEQEMIKVYELAKELGVDSISLLDKLNGLNIKVKSHMSELGPEELKMARSALGKKVADSAAPKKTVARTRKKATTETTSTTTAKEAASGASTKAPASSKESAATLASQTQAAAGASKSASPVIRRRVKSDGEATETVIGNSGSKAAPTHDSHHEDAAYAGAVTTSFEEDENVQAASDAHAGATQTTLEMDEAEAVVPASTSSSATTSSTAPAGASTTNVQAGPGATAAGATPAAPTQPTRPVSPVISRPVAPRRSILKIVEPSAPPPRPVIKPAPAAAGDKQNKSSLKGTTTQDKDGYRIVKMTKENLDQMVEEEAAKKRGGGREMDIRPEDVRFADYRKKEMVFLPKKKKIPVGKEIKRTQLTTPKAIKRVVEMQDFITVQELATQLNVKAGDVIRKLMGMGTMATMNQALDFDTATLISNDYQFEVKNVSFDEGALLGKTEDAPETLQSRPPVVTIMGHVDHGKTSLLDAIREANVAAGEAGGITQHIGAYTVEKNGKLITFIDTPGHEAFTVMRARGANVTDIVILVVAADDGVMPQTREALSHAKAANVPIIVAMNKIDKPGANPEKIKQQLAELDLLAEDWGGQAMFVPVSAIKKTNLDKLLESILLQAEVLDLKANPSVRATGTVLEAKIAKGRGAVVSVLVRRGTMRVGDAIVSGQFSGKVKAMTDDKGRTVKEASPGFAVEVLGFEGIPNAGDKFDIAASDIDARTIASKRIEKTKLATTAAAAPKTSLEDLFAKIQSGTMKELPIILKADVFGSVEAIRDSLTKLSNDQVKVKVIHSATGGITESDVLLATASNAVIVGFNVRPETKARQLAESEHIEVKCYNIIYELIDEIKKAMAGLLDKKKVEKFLGRAEVRQTFSVPKIGMIAGSAVIDGKITRGANVRLLRESRVIFEGKLSSLKRFKDDAKEVATGFECGIGIENYNDLKPGDIIEAYQIELVTPELNI